MQATKLVMPGGLARFNPSLSGWGSHKRASSSCAASVIERYAIVEFDDESLTLRARSLHMEQRLAATRRAQGNRGAEVAVSTA
jgi:hypothetical protein